MVAGRMTMTFDAEPGVSYLIEVTPRLAHFGIPGVDLVPTINEDSGTFKMNLIKQEK